MRARRGASGVGQTPTRGVTSPYSRIAATPADYLTHRAHDGAVSRRVLVVDDSEPMRTRLAAMLGEVDGLSVVGGAGDAAAAIRLLDELRPDVVVADLHMPGGGTTVLLHAKRMTPPPFVIVVTAHATAQHRRHCLALGADLFCDKGRELDRLGERLLAL
jgi:two-component system response regulator AlgR